MALQTREITKEDRAPDGNLLPTVRDRVLDDIQTLIKKDGVPDVMQIANEFKITYALAKTLISESLLEIAGDSRETISAQILYYESLAKQLSELPEYWKDASQSLTQESMTLIKQRSEVLDKVLFLRRLRDGNVSAKEAGTVNFHIWGTVKPKNAERFNEWQKNQTQQVYEQTQEPPIELSNI